jgi:hypothetical protein
MAISQVGSWQHLYIGESLTMPAGSAGDWIVFLCSWYVNTGPYTATGSVNGAYTSAIDLFETVTNTELQAFYFQNASASSETVSLSGVPDDCGCSGGRFSGVATSSSVTAAVGTAYTGAASTTVASGTPIDPATGDLILIFWADEGGGSPGTFTPAPGYSLLQQDTYHYDGQLMNLSATAGSQYPYFTCGDSLTNYALVVLDVAVAGAGPTVIPSLALLGVGVQ